jgi:conjugative transfer signal peptidase TraF
MTRAAGVAVIAWLVALTGAFTAGKLGVRWNVSPSVPLGFYLLSTTDRPVRGGYVAVCPTGVPLFVEARRRGYLSPGPCPGDFGPMIKVLAGVEGDRVLIGENGVRINGSLWPRSAPLHADTSGWQLPQLAGFRTELRSDEVVVLSEHCERGFDSRYFGPLPSSAIVATAVPLATW